MDGGWYSVFLQKSQIFKQFDDLKASSLPIHFYNFQMSSAV